MKTRLGVVVACAVGVSVGVADAAIVAVTGNIAHVPTPTGVLTPISFFYSMQAWDELQNVSVSGLTAEAINNPCDTRLSGPAPIPGVVSGTFDSHRIMSSDFTFYTGTIRFSGNIAAVILDLGSTLASDPSFAPPGLTFGEHGHAPNITSLQDMVGGGGAPGGLGDWISVSGDTLSFNELFGHPIGWGQGDVVEMRVLTYVPTPGVAAAMLGLAAVGVRRRRR